MIVFDLKCRCGFLFDGWFKSRTDFDEQKTNNLITCPECGSDEIHKILSPVAIHTEGTTSKANFANSANDANDEQAAITAESAVQFLRSVQDFVEKNFEDVGPKLAEESLKIHFGVKEPRNIRGVATCDEEKMLEKEGIELLKIPMVKKPTGPKLN